MAGILEQLAAEVADLQQRNAGGGQWRAGARATGFPSGTPQGPYLHGPNSIFGVYGVERDFFSTRIQPVSVMDMIPWRSSRMMNPLFGYITGFGDDTGTNPAGACDDFKTAGALITCFQTAQFGRYGRQTREFDITRAGQLINRGEMLDLRIVNDPLFNRSGGSTIAPNVPMSLGRGFQGEMMSRMLELGPSFQALLSRQFWNGNPANNNAGGGYKEFPGINILVGTSKYDALTNTACPSLASDIKNFNYNKVDSTVNDAGGGITQVISSLMHYLKHNASRNNMGEVNWVIVMRQELFWEITKVWPCSYLTMGCTNLSNNGVNSLVFDAADAVNMRDAMRNGSYLMVDGIQYPVVTDDGITEYTSTTNNRVSNGCMSSDIYVLPLTVRGGLSVLYGEYYDYSTAMEEAQDARVSAFFWTDGGKWWWHAKPPVNNCVQVSAQIEPRLVLLTPHLAGRIQNVQYCPLQHTREPFSDEPYYVAGGVSTARPGPSLYSEWNH
jgi:hypothetical protein